MSVIKWEENFATGIAEIDHEHKELIRLINDACEKYLHQEGVEDGVEEFLGEIYAKTAAHFALEEHVMRERNYDQYLDHKADHEVLLDEVRSIMDDYAVNSKFSQTDFSECLQDWFGTHFKTHDARFHKHLN